MQNIKQTIQQSTKENYNEDKEKLNLSTVLLI